MHPQWAAVWTTAEPGWAGTRLDVREYVRMPVVMRVQCTCHPICTWVTCDQTPCKRIGIWWFVNPTSHNRRTCTAHARFWQPPSSLARCIRSRTSILNMNCTPQDARSPSARIFSIGSQESVLCTFFYDGVLDFHLLCGPILRPILSTDRLVNRSNVSFFIV